MSLYEIETNTVLFNEWYLIGLLVPIAASVSIHLDNNRFERQLKHFQRAHARTNQQSDSAMRGDSNG